MTLLQQQQQQHQHYPDMSAALIADFLCVEN